MGLWDQFGGSLKDALSSAVGPQGAELISTLLAKANLGDLQSMLNQLQQSGLGEQVKSWLSNGPNITITPEQLRAALGNDQVRQLAQQFGVPIDDLLNVLAQHLPTAVDQASPHGRLQI
jgi:uncharacterized protein YidB (DUF937 family)